VGVKRAVTIVGSTARNQILLSLFTLAIESAFGTVRPTELSGVAGCSLLIGHGEADSAGSVRGPEATGMARHEGMQSCE
jgi:hypothetical protein